MDTKTANILREMNNRFYSQNAASFSSTRNNSWRGWGLVLEAIEGRLAEGGNWPKMEFRVLDVACGNLRFEEWLRSRWQECPPTFHCVDSCEDLLPKDWQNIDGLSFQNMDVLEALLAHGEDAVAASIIGEDYDLTCSFGFMHHIPGFDNRQKLLEALISKTRPGGFIAVSLWQFMNSQELARRAGKTTAAGLDHYACTGLTAESLEPGDYLLGWNGQEHAYRYCHHFDQEEAQQLIDSVAHLASPVAEIVCDGRTGNLNRYLILQRR